MSLTLNLGCVDIPYVDAKGVTTGDVAGFNENKYHLFTHFYEINQVKIADAISDSMAGALESVLMGAPADGVNAFASAESVIEATFKEFLTLDVMGSLGYPGVPTQAALDGVNSRLKLKHGPPRPSFIDSGTMQASLRAWVD